MLRGATACWGLAGLPAAALVPEIGAALAPEIQRFSGLSLADDESRGRPNARPALTCSIEDSTILLSACHEMSGAYSEGGLHEAAAYRSARAGRIRTNGCCTAGRRQQCCGPINQGKLV
jgi:hypothetical protein